MGLVTVQAPLEQHGHITNALLLVLLDHLGSSRGQVLQRIAALVLGILNHA